MERKQTCQRESIRHQAKCGVDTVVRRFGVIWGENIGQVPVSENFVSNRYFRSKAADRRVRPHHVALHHYGTFTVTVAMLRPYWFVA
jgi:hypothetical protein